MNALVAFRDHRAHAEQSRAFGRPIARRARPILLSGKHHQRHASLAVFHRGVVDGHFLAIRKEKCPAAFRARCELVAQANVRERTAHHDLMVTTARAVRVEFMRLHAVGDQVFPRGRIHGNRTSRRNVIGGDAVAKNRQHLGAVNVRQRRRCFRHVVEIRRQFDIGRFRIPLVNVALRNGHGLPVRVTLEYLAVLLAVLR